MNSTAFNLIASIAAAAFGAFLVTTPKPFSEYLRRRNESFREVALERLDRNTRFVGIGFLLAGVVYFIAWLLHR